MFSVLYYFLFLDLVCCLCARFINMKWDVFWEYNHHTCSSWDFLGGASVASPFSPGPMPSPQTHTPLRMASPQTHPPTRLPSPQHPHPTGNIRIPGGVDIGVGRPIGSALQVSLFLINLNVTILFIFTAVIYLYLCRFIISVPFNTSIWITHFHPYPLFETT